MAAGDGGGCWLWWWLLVMVVAAELNGIILNSSFHLIVLVLSISFQI